VAEEMWCNRIMSKRYERYEKEKGKSRPPKHDQYISLHPLSSPKQSSIKNGRVALLIRIRSGSVDEVGRIGEAGR
jgi:hypothetical protein